MKLARTPRSWAAALRWVVDGNPYGGTGSTYIVLLGCCLVAGESNVVPGIGVGLGLVLWLAKSGYE